MTDRKYITLLSALMLCLVAVSSVIADETYRERHADAKIDPARGVEGDVGFSDTIQYWRDEAAKRADA